MNGISEKIADFLKILGDQTRLEILDLLKNGENTSEDIQKALEKSQSTISQHLKTLIESELICFEKKGNKKYYKIKNEFIFKILTYIQSFVITLNKEKIKKSAELDIYDTLF